VGLANPDRRNVQFPFGLLGGLWSSAPYAGTNNPASLNLNDKHLLCHGTSCSDSAYDAKRPDVIVPPFGTYYSYGIWFDRDGVDPYQAGQWGAVDGGTYNTGGIYRVEITYHAVRPSPHRGTMFAGINGIQQGFDTSGWQNQTPDIYPAGKSFTDDLGAGLKKLRVMAMAYHYAESTDVSTIALTEISATGCLAR
jgi:hypothetical protein